MKKNLRKGLFTFTFALALQAVQAQWCIPTTIIPYASTMPGITNVTIGSINRTSADLENYPANSYVNTGLTTDLALGNTYTISISHTIDGSICPDMNLRVWIDYNLDYSFDDLGETPISVNHHAPGTYTGTFTIPATAVTGITRMRITAKMSSLGGHTLPTPCDMPNPDPLGYHGETEDYDVNLINATGINHQMKNPHTLSVFPTVITDHATISFHPAPHARIHLYNALGENLWTTETEELGARQEISLGESLCTSLAPGIYFLQLSSSEILETVKILVE